MWVWVCTLFLYPIKRSLTEKKWRFWSVTTLCRSDLSLRSLPISQKLSLTEKKWRIWSVTKLCGSDLSLHSFPISHKIEPNRKKRRFWSVTTLCGSDLSLCSFPLSHKLSLTEINEDSDQSQRYPGLIWVCTLFLYPIKRSLTAKMKILISHNIMWVWFESALYSYIP